MLNNGIVIPIQNNITSMLRVFANKAETKKKHKSKLVCTTYKIAKLLFEHKIISKPHVDGFAMCGYGQISTRATRK